MKILIISEFELIKTTIRKCLSATLGAKNNDFILAHPNQLSSFKTSIAIGNPDIALFDLDSISKTPMQQYEIKERLEYGEYFKDGHSPYILLMSTEQQYAEVMNKGEPILVKPFNLNILKSFMKDALSAKGFLDLSSKEIRFN